MNNEDIMEAIGLTKNESEVYFALTFLKEAKAGAVCKETGIASSRIYQIIDSLTKKGLVHYKMVNNTKIFMPSSPDVLNELFRQKQEKIQQQQEHVEQLIEKLKSKAQEKENVSNYKYYEGIPALRGMWHEIRNQMNKDSVEYIYGTSQADNLLGFYAEHHAFRKKIGSKNYMLLPNEQKYIKYKWKNNITDVKYHEAKSPVEWGVIDDMFYVLYSITKKPIGFLIKDPMIAMVFRETFEKLWDSVQ